MTHGTRTAYRRGCRCFQCRVSNTARQSARRAGDTAARISSREVTAFLTQLQSQGIGYRHVAQLAGVSPRFVLELRNGERETLRAVTANRILAIRPSLARGSLVTGWRTWRFLDSLLGEGFTRHALAGRLGTDRLQPRRRHVRAQTALKVRRMWDVLMREDGACLTLGTEEPHPTRNAEG